MLYVNYLLVFKKKMKKTQIKQKLSSVPAHVDLKYLCDIARGMKMIAEALQELHVITGCSESQTELLKEDIKIKGINNKMEVSIETAKRAIKRAINQRHYRKKKY